MFSFKPLKMLVLVFMMAALVACNGKNAEPTETEPPPPPSPEPTETLTPIPPPTLPPGYETALKFVGKWEGEWRNTTFGSKGPIFLETMANMDGTASFTIDIGGMVFGSYDPDPITVTGRYDAEGAYFELFNDPVFGQVTITISFVTSEITSMGELIPDPGIASMESTGTFTTEEITGEYTITFAGGGSAKGTVTLTKVEE